MILKWNNLYIQNVGYAYKEKYSNKSSITSIDWKLFLKKKGDSLT